MILTGCTSQAPDIQVVCERDEIGNYILKWETVPQIRGTVKLYVSDNPNSFSKKEPAAITDIADERMTYITNDNISRKYFQLVFNDQFYKTVSSRAVVMENIQNFRDMGGYLAEDKKAIRWGKLYRSGELSSLNESDSLRLKNLGIKTIIDFRTPREIEKAPFRYTNAKVIHIPISFGNSNLFFEKIREGRLRKGDALIFMQDTYIGFVQQQGEQFGKAFHVLLDEKNYPVVFNCTLGKDRTGFFAALILLALDIPESTIIQDYLMTNDYLDLKKFEDRVKGLNTEEQETITLLLTANEKYIDIALSTIKKEYGSYQKYFLKVLGISEKEQDKLKEILLY
jgi:protein-tyrosine phosphatase